MVEVVVAEDDGWDRELLAAVRAMTFAAFTGRFDEHDWEHTFGGVRVVALADGVPVAAGAVVPRTLLVGEREVTVGYVEGVATAPDRQGSGLGTAVMRAVGEVVRDRYELGRPLDQCARLLRGARAGSAGAGRPTCATGTPWCAPRTRTTGSWCCATGRRPSST